MVEKSGARYRWRAQEVQLEYLRCKIHHQRKAKVPIIGSFISPQNRNNMKDLNAKNGRVWHSLPAVALGKYQRLRDRSTRKLFTRATSLPAGALSINGQGSGTASLINYLQATS